MKNLIIPIIFFITIYVNASELQSFYISGDIVNVRKEPSTTSPIICKLRIGNIVLSSKQSNGWIYIDSVSASSKYSPPFVKINGWISEQLCSSVRFTKKILLDNLMKAETLEDSIVWYQRLVSMEPQDMSYARALQNSYLSSGDEDKAEGMNQKINGTETIYIALKSDGQLQVIGYIDASGIFTSLYWQERKDYIDEENYEWNFRDKKDKITKQHILRIKNHLSGLLWYGGPVNQGSIQLPMPYIIPEDYLKKNNLLSFGKESEYYVDIEGTVSCCLSLGSVPPYFSNLYATKPFHIIQPAGIQGENMLDSINWYKNKLLGNAIDKYGISRISFQQLPEYNLIDIAIGGRVENYEEFGSQRGVFLNGNNLIWPSEGHYSVNEFNWQQPWFRFGEDHNYPVFIITSFQDSKPHRNGSKGLQMIKVYKEGSQIFNINSEYYGD